MRGETRFKNAVFGGEVAEKRGLHQPGVFKDPSAPDDERYKMIHGGMLSGGDADRAYRHFVKRRPNDLDPCAVADAPASLSCMFGATSPDGMRWKPVAELLALHCSDTANNAYYDVTLQKYVWYGRINSWYERRCIARSETDDFRRFPFPRIIVRPDAGEEPWKDWYTNAKTVYPGTSSQHLMFPAQFRRIDEASEIHLFSSADGIYWDHVPGGPVIVQGPHGRPGDTWLRAWGNLVDLSEDRVGLMCDAELLPHKYPRRAGNRYREVNRPTTFWATWPKGRLSAIQAEEYGSFQTHQLKIRGRKLLLNFETKRAGEIRIEVARTPDGEAVPGLSFDDCDTLRGDSRSHVVTWRGQSNLGDSKENIVFRFQLRLAKLYSFESS